MPSRLLDALAYGARTIVMCARPSSFRERVFANEPPPDAAAGIISRLWLQWASGAISLGWERPLEIADLWQLSREKTAADARAELESLWAEERARPQSSSRYSPIARAAWRSIRGRMLITFVYKMGWLATCMVSNVYLLRSLVVFLAGSSAAPLSEGLLLALGFFLCECARSVCVNQHWLYAYIAGARLRAGVRAMLFEKIMRLRVTSVSTGKAVSLLSNDAARLLDACNYLEFIASAPVTILVALAVMLYVIGVSAIAGFAVLLICTPIQSRIGQWQGQLRRSTSKITDERVRLMAELLAGIRLVKLYCYERPFAEKVAGIRGREIAMLRSAAIVRALSAVVAFSLPVLVTLATFLTNALIGNSLTPAQAFIVVALFNVVRFPLGVLPQATRTSSEALVALQRMQDFLDLPEVRAEDEPVALPAQGAAAEAGEAAALARLRALLADPAAELPPREVAVELVNASFRWDAPPPAQGAGGRPAPARPGAPAKAASPDEVAVKVGAGAALAPFQLLDVSVRVGAGQVVAVVGAVGSGKSSLVSALLGHMMREKGAACVRGRVAYAAQSPFIFSGTVRSNILFGRPFEPRRYRRALRACALEPDLRILPAHDQTEIGEKGINLSGGQKARLSLARALYADADVYFLDDPLAAVDAHVGRHLWRRLIERELVRRGRKTVVIVTHQLQYLPRCDSCVVLEGGRVLAQATYAELLARGVDLRSASSERDRAVERDRVAAASAAADADPVAAKAHADGEEGGDNDGDDDDDNYDDDDDENDDSEVQLAGKSSSGTNPDEPSPAAATLVSAAKSAQAADAAVVAERKAAAGGKLVVAEDRSVGSVSGATVAAYFRAAGGLYVAVLIGLVLLSGKGMTLLSSAFLSYWTQGGRLSAVPPIFGPPVAPGSTMSMGDSLRYAGVYGGLVLGVVLLNGCQGLLFAMITLRSSQRLHNQVFAAVMRARLSWFESQPTGRVLSRFTGDVDTVDASLPATLESCLEFAVQCLLSIVLIVAVLPPFAGAVVPLLALFAFITLLFRRVARELKRLDNIARSPLVSHATATANGLATIRAYGASARFLSENEAHVDLSTRTTWQLC